MSGVALTVLASGLVALYVATLGVLAGALFRLSPRMDHIAERISRVEERLARVETRLDSIEGTLQNMDRRITALEPAAG